MKPGAKQKADEGALNRRALDLIKEQTTLTLATARGDVPWSAPVYYVFSKGSFYFFSSANSRHIKEALSSGSAAASIFAPADSWQAIRGIQMSGRIHTQKKGPSSLSIVAGYLKKYPFTSDFFPTGSRVSLDLFKNVFNADLYRFAPSEIHYLDNELGFGSRKKIKTLI